MWSRLLPCLVLTVIIAGGCSSDNDHESGDPFPHPVPPVTTMQMDLSDLEQVAGASASHGVCHALSALAVAWANANVVIRLAIPATVFTACIGQEPVYLGDRAWRWTATGGSGAAAWTGELTATAPVGTAAVTWEMRISGTPVGYDRVLWFSGESNPSALHGHWIYYDPARTPSTAVVRCEWARASTEGGARELAFTIVDASNPDHDDRLEYAVNDPIASVSYVDATANETVSIEWDVVTGAGMAMDAQVERCCWGPRPDYDDADCP
jgi:hypothetical protein